MNSELEQALSQLLLQHSAAALTRDAQQISENYRLRTGTGKRLLTQTGEAAAYAAARMPATFAAARTALSWTLEACGEMEIHTVLDCGAGTGAASWAACDLLEIEQVTCLEREAAMRSVGQALMQSGGDALAAANWQDCDLTADAPLPGADLVIEGYMLGELEEGLRIRVARRLFEAAGKAVLFIEPGTPQGFANLLAVRNALTQAGAHVAAPCPQGAHACPMKDGDWCHFTVRVQRSKLHKQLKGGDAPYEDEKFAYLALTREAPAAPCAARVLRHPQIAPGRIGLSVCGEDGAKNRIITKKDPLWKRARKISAGDAL